MKVILKNGDVVECTPEEYNSLRLPTRTANTPSAPSLSRRSGNCSRGRSRKALNANVRWTSVEDAEICTLKQQGFAPKRIAHKLGRSPHSISDRLVILKKKNLL